MIDWDLLAQLLADKMQIASGPARATSLRGGDINQSFRLALGQQSFFVKLNRAERLSMFEAERDGLEAIRGTASIRVPEVYLTGCQADTAYIVMEYIEFSTEPDMEGLAVCLAGMHGHFHQRFGFERDNTIGSTPQLNRYTDNWPEFWRRQRLEFQLQLAARNHLDAGLIDAGHRLSDKLDIFFETWQPRPSLVHGDLWSGNQATDIHGNPVVFDPACYFADHEVDLAMLELFGNPGERFFARYHEIFPIDCGYPVRRELYNLYHVLNHANLFGGGYAARARQMIDRLLAA